MGKQVTEENFFEILEVISNKRYEAMDEVDELFAEMIASKDTSDLSDSVWSSLALELYLIGRGEDAVQAMLIAVKIGEEREGDERSQLSAMYGDLAMMQEGENDFEAAYDASMKSYVIRKSFNGEDDILTRTAKEQMERLEHFKGFKKDEALHREFLDSFKDKPSEQD